MPQTIFLEVRRCFRSVSVSEEDCEKAESHLDHLSFLLDYKTDDGDFFYLFGKHLMARLDGKFVGWSDRGQLLSLGMILEFPFLLFYFMLGLIASDGQ